MLVLHYHAERKKSKNSMPLKNASYTVVISALLIEKIYGLYSVLVSDQIII